MKVAFRTDATNKIGTGHFMRCLTLAEELKNCGVEILFVSRSLAQYLRDMLEAKGMEFVSLKSDCVTPPAGDLPHSHWLNTSQEQDARETRQALSGREWDWLIVDHYALDERWESALRPSVGRIMVIDDIADRSHDCDLILDQNFYVDMEERYVGKTPAHCRQLLGPRYALLRSEFRELRKKSIQRRAGPVNRILVFFGGVDADNYTGCTIEVLAGLKIGILHVDVVIGLAHPFRERIEAQCKSHGYHCHVQSKRMAELMASADMAIGAGGSAMWERCCLGLPVLTVCVASNQLRQIADAAEQGLIYSISGEDFPIALQRHISVMLENGPLRKLISRVGMMEVDGFGSRRVVAALGASNIVIRVANESDSPKLFEWRNHQVIRSVSKNTARIAWVDHQSWFARVQAEKNSVLLIGEINNEPVGVVRFDQEGETALVSIYKVPTGSFNGQGLSLLLKAEEWLKTHRAYIKSIWAEVLSENGASQRLFTVANYRLESLHYSKEL